MQVENKVALVTGGASGIGLKVTKTLLKNGIKGVIMTDINQECGVIKEDKLRKKYGYDRVLFKKLDVTNEEEFEEGFQTALSKYKQLDIVINNAGIVDDVNFAKTIDINITGTTRGTILALKYMSKENANGTGGIIINLSSIIALRHEFRHTSPIYATSKSAILALSQAFGHKFHYDKSGVRVVSVCPGLTNTPILRSTTLISKCYREGIRVQLKNHPFQIPQKVSSVARSILYLIRNAESATIWAVESNNLYFIDDKDLIENKHLIKENI